MAVDNEARTSRRRILAAAIGGAGALAVSRLAGPGGAAAANGDPALLGVPNTSTLQTSFLNTTAGQNSVEVTTATGHALNATATDGIGVNAIATGSGTAVLGAANSQTGVGGSSVSGLGIGGGSQSSTGAKGTSFDNTPSTFVDPSNKTGVIGIAGDDTDVFPNTDETGVYGFSNVSDVSTGVWGDSIDGTGVYGSGTYGVYGAGFVGLYGKAANASSYALFTEGKIKFYGRSGRSTITSGHQYKDVTISGMTTASAVIVTLQTYKSGFAVAAAVSYAGKFRFYLNKTATSSMAFSYLVIG
jgi:hypothetical protein